MSKQEEIASFSFSALQSEAEGRRLVSALQDIGFAVITDHGIDPVLFSTFYSEWQTFFNLPEAEKENYLHTAESQSGFFPQGCETAKGRTVADLKEFYQFYRDRSADPTEGITRYIRKRMNDVGEVVLARIEDGLPPDVREKLTEPLTSMVANTDQTLFRVIHYPALSESEMPDGAVRAAALEDINLITLLPMATAEGLEVLRSDGSWLPVGGDAGALVMNVGDMLQEATQGYLKSTTHRVVNNGLQHDRYSAPLFIHPRPDVTLSDRYTARSYLDERLKELGLKGS